MGSEEVKNFIECSAGSSTSAVSGIAAKIMSWDADADGKITLEDFLAFYK